MAVTIEDFAAAVWNEACLREGARSDLLRRDGEVGAFFSPCDAN